MRFGGFLWRDIFVCLCTDSFNRKVRFRILFQLLENTVPAVSVPHSAPGKEKKERFRRFQFPVLGHMLKEMLWHPFVGMRCDPCSSFVVIIALFLFLLFCLWFCLAHHCGLCARPLPCLLSFHSLLLVLFCSSSFLFLGRIARLHNQSNSHLREPKPPKENSA